MSKQEVFFFLNTE